MRSFFTLILASVFVFLAGFNIWNMLASRGTSTQSRKLWVQIHRAAGYAFIALFLVLLYFMLLRIKGASDELPPRLVLHMGLALLLAPLLITKVIVARYQKAERGLLSALGIAIFSFAFTLVVLNASVHYLRNSSAHKLPVEISLTVIAGVLLLAGVAYLRPARQPRLKSEAAIPAGPQLSSLSEPLNLTLARIEPQTSDAKTLRFLLPHGRQLGARAGQFLTFEWVIDGKPVTRSYSICSSPAQTAYVEITPKRIEGGRVSQFLNDRAQPGLAAKARGPYGRFYFDESRHGRIVLIAGGSGITPMIAMLRYMDDLCIPADVKLLYCVRAGGRCFSTASWKPSRAG